MKVRYLAAMVFAGLFLVGLRGGYAMDHDPPIRPALFPKVRLADRFRTPPIETNRRGAIPYALGTWEETGRIDNFALAGGPMQGKRPGDSPFEDPDDSHEPHQREDNIEAAFEEARKDLRLLETFVRTHVLHTMPKPFQQQVEDAFVQLLLSSDSSKRFAIGAFLNAGRKTIPARERGSVTISQAAQNIIRFQLEYPKDRQPFGAGGAYLPVGHGSIWRFKGTVTNIMGFTFTGGEEDPLRFVLAEGRGLLHLYGTGQVVLLDGTTVSLPGDKPAFEQREATQPTVTIDVRDTGEPISENIYGQCIEHVGRCIYGGIWAEMLEDRKFFYPVGANESVWETIGSSDTVVMEEQDAFVGAHTPVIRAASGIHQRDLGVVRHKEYVGHIWVKPAAVSGADVEVSLVWGDGPEQQDSKHVTVNAGGYREYPLSFTAGASTDRATLEIRVSRGDACIGTVSLMPVDNVEGMRADTLKLLKALNATIYRWPGGSFVSGYNWRDGIGPRDERPPRKNPAWLGLEQNDFGLDEFVAFCREVGAEPMIAVNSGLGDARSAAEEVEYANGSSETPMGKWRAKNGHPQPYNVKWWCVGNEMFGDWQLGHMSLDHYVHKHNLFAKAMWAVDRDIKLIAVGAVGEWSEGMLTHCAGHMDLISEHFYRRDKDSVVEHTGQAPEIVRHIVQAHRHYREKLNSLERKDIRIAIDEWNYWYGQHVFGELGTRYFMKDALGVAAGLHEMIRNTDMVCMANYAQAVNVLGAVKTTKTAAAFETTGLVLKLYRNHFGTVPVAVSGQTHELDVVAAWTADKQALTIGIVNPIDVPQRVRLALQGGALEGSGRWWLISHDDPMVYNDPGTEPKVVIREKDVAGVSDQLTVPAYSVSLCELRVQ